MPRIKKLTTKFLEDELRRVLKNGVESEKVQAIRILKDILFEQQSQKQTQRQKVTNVITNEKELQELIEWKPHLNQEKILASKDPIIIIAAGKGFGKTVLCSYIALKTLLEDNKKILIVAPSYGLTGRVREYLDKWITNYFKGEIKIITRPFPTYITKWGSYIDCRSGEQPTEIQGKAYDLTIVDECAGIDRKVQETYIANASREKEDAKYFYISTPKGRTWLWELWNREESNGGSFKFKSIDNPYFPKEQYEKFRRTTPEMIFKQEYEAEFLGTVIIFKGLENCMKDYQFPEEYNENHLYLMGIDLGRYRDYTVVAVMDMMTNRLSNLVIFQGEWGLQKQKIISISDKYGHCPIWIDATSITVGDAYVQELENAGYYVTGYKINSNVSKRQLIEKLVVLIQNNSITLPIQGKTEDTDTLITQMNAFTFDVTPGGVIRYMAPQGGHDDAVLALAFGCFDLEDKPLTEMKKGHSEVYLPPKQEF